MCLLGMVILQAKLHLSPGVAAREIHMPSPDNRWIRRVNASNTWDFGPAWELVSMIAPVVESPGSWKSLRLFVWIPKAEEISSQMAAPDSLR